MRFKLNYNIIDSIVQKTVFQKLNLIHNTVLRIISGIYEWVLFKFSWKLKNQVSPFNFRRKRLSIIFAIKVST